MKSMDKIMGMEDYYESSIEGEWTSVKPLPTSTSTKLCPECQTPVKDIKRYGRIIKKRTLDIQNRKFILRYDRKLKGISKHINNSFNEMKKMRNELRKELPDNPKLKTREEIFQEHEVSHKGLPEITPYHYFESIAQYHGFDEDSENVWLSHVSKLLKCYQNLVSVIYATKRSPHKKAFEVTISNL